MVNGERARLRYELASIELLIELSSGLDDAVELWETAAAVIRAQLGAAAGPAPGTGMAAGPQLPAGSAS
jgi:hypothetical protein